MQHMFPFKACHCLPAFLLASAFPRELSMSLVGSAQCWPLCWKIKNLVCYLNFSSPSKCQVGASCRSCLSREAWLWWSLMEKGTDGRSLSPNLTCTWLSCPSAGCAGWHKVGHHEGTPSPKPRWDSRNPFLPFSTQESFQDTARCHCCPKPQGCVVQNSSAPRAGLLWLLEARLISPKWWVADPAVLEESLQMGILSGCALKLDWDEESSELSDGARGKSWATAESPLCLRSQRVSQSDVNGTTGRHKSSCSKCASGLGKFTVSLYQFSRNTFFTCYLIFFFQHTKISLHISSFSNSFMWNPTSVARNPCWALLQLPLKYILHN